MKKIALVLLLLFGVTLQFSYAQEDEDQKKGVGIDRSRDTLPNYVKIWTLDQHYNKHYQPLDTFLESFQSYHPAFQHSFSGYDLGNFGTPLVSKLFFSGLCDSVSPILKPDFLFLEPYSKFIYLSDDLTYYNTNKPHSTIKHTTNWRKKREELTLKFLYTQNVNPFFNIGLRFNLFASAGQYKNQKTRNSNIVFFASYNKARYSLYANTILNSLNVNENGGLTGKSLDLEDYELIPIYLQTANSTIKSNSFQLIQQYALGKSSKQTKADTTTHQTDSLKFSQMSLKSMSTFSKISHKITYTDNQRIYQDKSPTKGYYRNNFLDTIETFDSIRFRVLNNIVEWQLNEGKYRPGVSFAAGNEWVSIYNLRSFVALINDRAYKNNYGLVNIFKHTGVSWDWEAEGKLYFTGYKQGDYNLSAHIFKFFGRDTAQSLKIQLWGDLRRERPDYFVERYYSNNYKWDSPLLHQNDLTVRGVLSLPKWRTNVGAIVSVIDNYTYFDSTATPKQASLPVEVISVFLNNELSLGKFHLINRVVAQKTNNTTIIHIPTLVTYHSFWMEQSFFKQAINTHLGFDLYFSSLYFSPAYTPATGMFYLQNKIETGNYPVFDVFINAYIKKMRLFFKFEHLNYLVTKQKYFPVVNYPMHDFTFRFGVAWRFND